MMRLWLASIGLLLLSGCYSAGKPYTPIKKKEFDAVERMHAPELVYNRLRWVYLPEPLPAADAPSLPATILKPVVHLELKNVNMEEAAQSLASLSRYRSFVESGLIGRKVSFDSLGTLDELALQMASKEGIEIEVDHGHRLVRFMAKDVRPSFYRGESWLDEHQ